MGSPDQHPDLPDHIADTAEAQAAPLSVAAAAELERLAELLNHGLLTRAEFDERKRILKSG
jgi:Short C-terminal domain